MKINQAKVLKKRKMIKPPEFCPCCGSPQYAGSQQHRDSVYMEVNDRVWFKCGASLWIKSINYGQTRIIFNECLEEVKDEKISKKGNN